MALTKGSSITWTDIQTVITKVNAARTNFGITASPSITGGGKGVTAKASTITDIYNALRACHGKTYSGGTVSVASITMPTRGSLIKPDPLSSIATEADRIAGLRYSFFSNDSFFGSSFFANDSFFGSSFNSSFRANFSFFSSFDSSFRSSFDSSFRGSNNSGNFAFFSTGDGAFFSGFTGNGGFAGHTSRFSFFSAFQGPIGVGGFFS